MSPRLAPSAGGGSSGGRLAISIVMVLAIAVAMLLLVRAKPEVGSYDPRSSRDDGARAMVLLLESRGAEVEISRSAPRPGTEERVLVLADRLTADQRGDLLDWIEAGGIAVVADPQSSLHGGAGVDGGALEVSADEPSSDSLDDVQFEINVPVDQCSIGALQSLRGLFVPNGVLFPVAPGEPQCFAADGHAFVVARQLGSGLVVGLGDNDVLTNRYLRYGDNSGLATALLTPGNDDRVRVLIGGKVPKTVDDIGSGEERLVDLVRPGVWMALAQLALAFVVFAFARGIRTGRPVDERRAVPLAGSEFVAANGTLLQRAQHSERAAWVVRGRFYRDLCHALRQPPNTPIELLDRAAADRFGTVVGEITTIFQTVVTDQQQLLALTQAMHRVRVRLAPTMSSSPRSSPHSTPHSTPHYTGSSS